MSYRKKYEEDLRKDSQNVFEEHRLCKKGEGRWLIKRKREEGWESMYAAEIICLFNNSIYVGGDIDTVVFSYGPPENEQRLRWLGRQTSGTEYLREKASIGMGGRELVEDWDPQCAREELREALEELEKEEKEEEGEVDHEEEKETLRHALRLIDDGSSAVWQVLYDIPDSWESFENLGQVTSPKVFYAQAAVAKLCELLGLFEEKSEPEPEPKKDP